GNPRALGGNPDITPYLQGPSIPANPQEMGWKDTVMCPPGMVTRFAVRWAPQELATNLEKKELVFIFNPHNGGYGYVWHCHIVDHEDNEMMRPTQMQSQNVNRSYIKGVDY
ncbi:MAG: multicopper oxidase domain-containing protein, partial [Anaerolineae bacterium]